MQTNLFVLSVAASAMVIDYILKLKELKKRRGQCQRCKKKSPGPALEFAHINKRKTYTVGQVCRKKFAKPSQKKKAFTESVGICFLLCRECHVQYDKPRSGTRSVTYYEEYDLGDGVVVRCPVWSPGH